MYQTILPTVITDARASLIDVSDGLNRVGGCPLSKCRDIITRDLQPSAAEIRARSIAD